MIDPSRPVVYYGSPIRGAMGKDATDEYMMANCRKAVANVQLLRQRFPEIDWYCPAENDLIIQVLYRSGKLTEEEILWADCEIIRQYCSGYFGAKWEPSGGIDIELRVAELIPIPNLIITKESGLPIGIFEVTGFLEDVEACHAAKTKRSESC